MKKLTLITIFSLLFLLSLSFSVVAEEFIIVPYVSSTSFTLSADVSPNVCSCAGVQIPITLSNIGTLPSVYTIVSSDESVSLSTSAAALAGGQQTTIIASIDLACVPFGPIDSFTVTVLNGLNQKQIIQITPEVVDCFATSFALSEINLSASSCHDVPSTLYITNDGKITQNYTIKTSPATTSLSAGSVSIPPNAVAKINATFRFACGETKSQLLEYEIESSGKDMSYLVEQQLTFVDDYQFSLRSSTDKAAVCAADSTTVDMLLQNTMDFPNQFTLTVNAADFISVAFKDSVARSGNTLWLQAGEEVPFVITASPDEFVSGTFPVEVIATSKYGKQQVRYALNVSVNTCHAVDVSWWTPKTKYVCANDKFSEPLSLISKGTEDTRINLRVEGSEFAALENDSVLVPANGSVDVNLTFNPFNVEKTSEKITVVAEYANRTLAKKEFTLVSDSLKTCYGITVIGSPTKKISYAKEGFTVVVKNEGTRYGDYVIAASENTSTIELLDDHVALGKSETTALDFIFFKDVSAGDVFNVSLAFTQVNSLETFTEEVQVIIVDDPLWKRIGAAIVQFIIDTSLCALITLALLALLIIAAIILVFRSYKKRKFVFPLKTTGIVIVIAILVFIGAYILVGGFPQLYTHHDLSGFSTTHLLLEEDTARTFDLNEFFVDPDNNIELFGISSINESLLQFNLSDNLLKLDPVSDWNGQTMIQIFAMDSEGLIAESQVIRVDVLAVEDYSLWGLYSLLCAYVNVFLFWVFLVLVIVFFAYPKKPIDKQTTLTDSVTRSGTKKNYSVTAKKNTTKKVTKSSSKRSASKKPVKKTYY